MGLLKQICTAALLLVLTGQAWAQDGFKGKALGAAINTEYEELMPRISPNGQVLYFVRGAHPGNAGGASAGQDIWSSRRDLEGNWGTAEPLSGIVNDQRHNFVGALADKGEVLVLGNCYEWLSPGISSSRRSANSWSFPKDIFAIEGGNSLSFHATPDLNYIVLSMSAGSGEEDLFVSMKLGETWSEPQSLGAVVNSAGSETAPFISADGRRLFFTSDGHPGHKGGGDIYMSERQGDAWDSWSEPVHLGDAVNTGAFDGYFCLDDAERLAYFVSGPGSGALGDIYEIPISAIPALAEPIEAETLYVETLRGKAVELSLLRYGVPDDAALLVEATSLDGPGQLLRNGRAPYFVYQPSPEWIGTEMLEVVYCDPPQSENCKRVFVRASTFAPATPIEPLVLRESTQMETPLRLELPRSLLMKIDVPTSLALNKGRKGKLDWVNEPASEYLRYTPEDDFVGGDSLVLVGFSDKSAPILAEVYINVWADMVGIPDSQEVVPDTQVVVSGPIEPEEPKDFLLFGTVLEEGKEMRPGAFELRLFDDSENKDLGALPVKDGEFAIRLPSGKSYRIEAASPFHYPVAAQVPGDLPEVERNIVMNPLPVETGQVFTLNNIYFDLDKSTLRPESADELGRLYEFLKSYPTMEIEVRGHTDSQNTVDYNQRLSEDRVTSVINYLKYRGIMGYRLQGRGFGELEPVATNETPEGRQKNRRVEFIILKK